MSVDALVEALEARHLTSLTFPEVRRALQAVSRIYVQRRDKLDSGAVFDGAGKRAAFALFYGPLHYMLTTKILGELESDLPRAKKLIDLGCGTGVVGAAWASQCQAEHILGIDVEGWVLREAQWTYATLSLAGRTKRVDAGRQPLEGYDAIALGYVVNELSSDARDRLLSRLLSATRSGSRVLVLEPISKKVSPWWGSWRERFVAEGGRDDEWRFEIERPELIARLDKAARLDHRVIKGRTLYLG